MSILIVAWLDVRSKPLRTLAAIGGMVAAVMAVIIVDAAGILSRQANDEYIATTWGRTATLAIGPADGSATMTADESTDAGQRLVASLTGNGITRVSTDVSIGMVLLNGTNAVPTYPTWVSSTYPDISFVDLMAGDFPQTTALSPVPHAVIRLDMAQRLGFSGPDAVGQTIQFTRADGYIPDLRIAPIQTLVIDAVARTIGTSSDSKEILIVSDQPIPASLSPGQPNWLMHVHPNDLALATSLVQGLRVAGQSQPVFQVRRVDQSEDLAPLLAQQSVTARSVSLVALIVGGLGILGVGLAGVRERAKDFGLRRALGSNKFQVFAGVIVQTLIEVLLGAVIAIPMAALAVTLFARDLVLRDLPLPESTALPVESAVRGLIAALLVGLIAGLLPALRAARLSVVQALRD